jgi:glucokinase
VIGAVDVGGTKIAVGLVDRQGQIYARAETPTTQMQVYPVAIARLASELRRLEEAGGAPLEGIGVGLTGQVDPASQRLTDNGFMPDWTGRALASDLSLALGGLGVAIENDADAAALAEARWGAGQGCRVFLYVTISTGIGGGLVIDGRLYRGAGGWHQEIGRMKVGAPPALAQHDEPGVSWEQLASGPALAKSYQAMGGAERTAAEICAHARQGEALACQAVAAGGYWLGWGLANLINVYAPERIALGGGLMRAWDLFEPYARAVIARNCYFLLPRVQTRIVPALLGDAAPLAGAACVWITNGEVTR